jgi:hypothetical protein
MASSKKTRATVPDWVVDHPRALCLARVDPEFMKKVASAQTREEQAECLREAIRRFPKTSADVLMLHTELEAQGKI